MTTGIDHTIAPWGYSASGGSAQVNGQQGAYRTGRKYPSVPSIASSSTTVRPYVVPWLATSDSFGVSFPSGIVGVTTVVKTGSSLSGNLNADYESQWSDLTKGTGIIPVPSVLPSDYTANLDTPGSYSGVPPNRLRSASGFADQTWGPTGSPNGISDIIDLTDFDVRWIFDGTNYVYQIPVAIESTGCRSMRIKNNFVPGGVQPTCTISHNHATGTRPTGTNEGDTIDATFTLASDLSYVTIGSATAKTGVPTVFVWRFAVAPPPTTVLSGRWTVDISPRVDVPYCLTISGQGDLIAPGGYPT